MDGQTRRSRCSSRVNIFRNTLQHLCTPPHHHGMHPRSIPRPYPPPLLIAHPSAELRAFACNPKAGGGNPGNPEATIQACLARQSLPEKHNQEAAESINNLSHRDSQETSSATHKAYTGARSGRPKIVPRGNFTQKICAVRE